MRNFSRIFLLSIFVVSNAYSLSLRFPLYEIKTKKRKSGNEEVMVPLHHRNAALKKAGSEIEFPVYLEASTSEKGIELMEALNQDVAKAEKVLSDSIQTSLWQNLSKYSDEELPYRLCYSDNARDAQDEVKRAENLSALVNRFPNVFLSDQLTVYGVRYGKEGMWLHEQVKEEDQEDWPETWIGWRGTGEAAVILSTDDDEGTKLQADLLRYCPTEDKKHATKKAKPKKARKAKK